MAVVSHRKTNQALKYNYIMKLFEITTGFIAAVLVALGAYQYVNKTQVGEEAVVEENAVVTQLYVYQNSTSDGARNPGNWIPEPPQNEPNCGEEGPVPCKIHLDLSQYDDMEEYLDTQNFASDDDVVNGPGITSKL